MNIRFYEQKPNLELREFDDNIYVYIYLNEAVKEEVEINYPESVNEENVKHTVYYYDYAEFCEKKENLDLEDLKAHPEKYLDYVPKVTEDPKPKTLEEQIQDLKDQNDMLTQCVLEMSELVYQ